MTEASAPPQLVIAVDVGGTSMKGGLVEPSGTVLCEVRRSTGAADGPDQVVRYILGFVADLAERVPAGAVAAAVGLGVPGIVDPEAGIARYAANLGWHDVPIRRLTSEKLGLPVALGHDVRNGALAEARLGAGAGAESAYFVAIGTGVAAGMVRRGRVEDGATGRAGELGHIVVRPGGPRCNCGNRGCLEAIASASRIALRYRETTGRNATARDVSERARAGEAAAVAVWDEAVAALADALTTVIVLQDPGRIVLGGGLSLAGDFLLTPLAEAVSARLTFREAPPIVPAVFGDSAGLVGAALRAFDMVGSLSATAGSPGADTGGER